MKETERATLLSAIAELTTIIDGMLQMLNRILDGCDEGGTLTPTQVAELRDHAMNWAKQVAQLKIAMASAALRPSKRRH
jgi:hypothetical protein